MIEVTKACIVAFMKARYFLVNVERRKKTEDDENVLCKALAKIFFVNIKRLFTADLLWNGLQ